MDQFPSDTTLWLILRKFESSGGTNLNFTARGVAEVEVEKGTSGAGRIFYEKPVLNVAGRELSDLEDLQKTLANLGHNKGSTLIRLDFKKTDRPLEQAMKEIGQYFNAEDTSQESANAESSSAALTEDTITAPIAGPPSAEPIPEDFDMTSLEASEGPSADPSPFSEQARNTPLPVSATPSNRPAPETREVPILGPDQRPVSVFSPPSNNTPRAALVPHNEEDFEPTIAHAKLHQSRLQNNTQNKRLLSDAEAERAEAEKAAKLASKKEVSIKVRFPDQSSMISTFNAQETCAQLYAFVTGVIAAEDQSFKLVWTSKGPPQTVPRDEKKKLIKDLGFEGRMLVNFVWDDAASEGARKGPTLKPQYFESAKEVQVPEPPPAPKEDDENEKPVDKKGKGKEHDGTGESKGKAISRLLQRLSKK